MVGVDTGKELLRLVADNATATGAETRGVFRIPGSVRIVNSLYNYYCADSDVDDISSTICRPDLPSHIKAGSHDVASTFKRLLSGLPGGVLGSLSVFESLVSLQGQLDGEGEPTKTKQPKIKARLIALAIGTVTSQLRRDLICAVFGLLCLIGSAAEKAPREDEHGKPLPTSDLMGYSALGIVFGPLLIGDLLGSYTVNAAQPPVGPASALDTSPNVRSERRQSKILEDAPPQSALAIDKIHLANSITEMLITHWQEVVGHMRRLTLLKGGHTGFQHGARLRPSTSALFRMSMPLPGLGPFNAGESPVVLSPTPEPGKSSGIWNPANADVLPVRALNGHAHPSLVLPRRRPKGMRPLYYSLAAVEMSLLSPPVEEPSPVGFERPKGVVHNHHPSAGDDVPVLRIPHPELQERLSSLATPNRKSASSKDPVTPEPQRRHRVQPAAEERGLLRLVPVVASKGANPFKRRSYQDNTALDSASCSRKPAKFQQTPTARTSQDTQTSVVHGSEENKTSEEAEKKAIRDAEPRTEVYGIGRSRLSAWRLGRKLRGSTDSGSPVARPLSRRGSRKAATEQGNQKRTPQPNDQGLGRSKSPSIHGHQECSSEESRCFLGDWASQTTAPIELGSGLEIEPFSSGSHMSSDNLRSSQSSGFLEQFRTLRSRSGNITAQRQSEKTDPRAREVGTNKDTETPNPATLRPSPRGLKPDSAQPTLGTVPRSTPVTSAGNSVKAMAAKFESVSKDSIAFPSPQERTSSRGYSKPSGILSPYTVNPSPAKSPSKSPKLSDSVFTGRHVWLSTIRDRRSRVSGGVAHRTEGREKNSFDDWQGTSPKPARGKMANGGRNAANPSGSEPAVSLLPPERTGTLKQPPTPECLSFCADKGGSPSGRELPPQWATDTEQNAAAPKLVINTSAPTSEPQHDPSTPHSQNNTTYPSPYPRSNPASIASPASTTRRFLLLPTPEQKKPVPSQSNPKTPAVQNNGSPNAPSTGSTLGHATTTPSHNPKPNLKNKPGDSPRSSIDSKECQQHDIVRDMELELAGLRDRLCLAEQACVEWRERAERAERRVLELEGESAGGV